MRRVLAALITIVVFASGSAHATLIDWSISSYSENSPMPAGTFTFNSETWEFTNVSISGITGTEYTSAVGTPNIIYAAVSDNESLFSIGWESLSIPNQLFVYFGSEETLEGKKYFKGYGYGVARAVSEPTVISLLGLGLIGGVLMRRRRAK